MNKESLESRIWRWFGNWFPAYRGSGAKVTYVSSNFQDVCIKLPCNWKTKNHMGITWGGSLYAALDPIYGVMLYKILERQYKVIDSQASICFLKPSKGTLYAHFQITDDELLTLKKQLTHNNKARMCLEVRLTNKQGVVHVVCEKHIHIRNSI
ncbi:DUF4442 domain-containing protein [uncultured Paraglaciecola sp.]|uniref:DUF4442 domain-containing protein n=1 Tax=uncultured Paraglaciecola sp. TaxID=1765024 RepID=UPI00261C1C37|nr:DUF4442 domain-containing protein [uncultured Paraglaciecola sp.]